MTSDQKIYLYLAVCAVVAIWTVFVEKASDRYGEVEPIEFIYR